MRWLIIRLTPQQFQRFVAAYEGGINPAWENVVAVLEKMPGFFSVRKRAKGRRIMIIPDRGRGEKCMEEGEL